MRDDYISAGRWRAAERGVRCSHRVRMPIAGMLPLQLKPPRNSWPASTTNWPLAEIDRACTVCVQVQSRVAGGFLMPKSRILFVFAIALIGAALTVLLAVAFGGVTDQTHQPASHRRCIAGRTGRPGLADASRETRRTGRRRMTELPRDQSADRGWSAPYPKGPRAADRLRRTGTGNRRPARKEWLDAYGSDLPPRYFSQSPGAESSRRLKRPLKNIETITTRCSWFTQIAAPAGNYRAACERLEVSMVKGPQLLCLLRWPRPVLRRATRLRPSTSQTFWRGSSTPLSGSRWG